MRYSRLAKDLRIPTEQLKAYLLPAGASPADYLQATVAPADAATWFGKEPPDLSLMRALAWAGQDLPVPQDFLQDPTRPTRTNNLAGEQPCRRCSPSLRA